MCRCRARKGIKNGPKDWEYERFSFVALRKQPRRPAPRDVYINPAYREYEEDVLDYVAMPPALAAAARAGASADLDPLDIFPFFRTTAVGTAVGATTPPVDVAEGRAGADAAREEREDAAADVAGGDGVWGPGVQEDEEDEEGEEREAEEAARARAAAFLDEYLRAMVQDKAAPAAGAIESLRLRMVDAGVLPQADGDGAMNEAGRPVPSAARGEAGDRQPRLSGPAERAHRVSDAVAGGGVKVETASSEPAQHAAEGPSAGDGDATRESSARQVSADISPGAGRLPAQPFMHLGTPEDSQLVREGAQREWDRASVDAAGGQNAQVRSRIWVARPVVSVNIYRFTCACCHGLHDRFLE